MIVVLDTNVIISSLLSPKGSPSRIMEGWEAEKFDVAISQPLIGELERVLGYEKILRHFSNPPKRINALLKRFASVGLWVEPQTEYIVIQDDPDDNRVLECAVAASASYIISGDEHLLALEEFQGIRIITPAGFLALLDFWHEQR